MTPQAHQGFARRDLLAALVALTASSALPAFAKQEGTKAVPAFDDLDHDAVERIGRAWLAKNPGINAPALAKRLFPDGRGPSTLAGLRQRTAQDFREGKVFVHRGWRLSDTEGALFGLLTLET